MSKNMLKLREFIEGLEGKDICIDWIIGRASIPRPYSSCCIQEIEKGLYEFSDGICEENSQHTLDLEDFNTYEQTSVGYILKKDNIMVTIGLA